MNWIGHKIKEFQAFSDEKKISIFSHIHQLTDILKLEPPFSFGKNFSIKTILIQIFHRTINLSYVENSINTV